MKVCVVTPTYNERENIASFIGAIYGAMRGEVTVCVLDDSSPDGTAGEVEALQKLFSSLILIKRPKKEGLGRAYVDGFTRMLERNEFDVIVMIDSDFSEHPLYIPKALAELSHADVVTGSRYVKGSKIYGWDLKRKVLSFFANRVYARLIIGLPVNDVTMGFNVMRAGYLKRVDLTKLPSAGYAFIMELKAALYKEGARFAEIPIVFVERIEGRSKISSRVIKEGVIAPWRIRFPHWFT